MINNIVVRYKDGITIKGHTTDFSPNKKTFPLDLLNGEVIEINVELLKAIYFVKNFTGNKDHKDSYTDIVAGEGKKIEVLFNDGEKLIGYSQDYSRTGFFVIPADKGQNNERIFIITSATKKVIIL